MCQLSYHYITCRTPSCRRQEYILEELHPCKRSISRRPNPNAASASPPPIPSKRPQPCGKFTLTHPFEARYPSDIAPATCSICTGKGPGYRIKRESGNNFEDAIRLILAELPRGYAKPELHRPLEYSEALEVVGRCVRSSAQTKNVRRRWSEDEDDSVPDLTDAQSVEDSDDEATGAFEAERIAWGGKMATPVKVRRERY